MTREECEDEGGEYIYTGSLFSQEQAPAGIQFLFYLW